MCSGTVFHKKKFLNPFFTDGLSCTFPLYIVTEYIWISIKDLIS